MTARLRAFWIAAFAPALFAQIQIEVRTLSPLTARTDSGAQTIAPGTVLHDGQGVSSRFQPPGFQCQSDASATINLSSSATAATVTFTTRSTSFVQSVSSCPMGAFAESGRHEIQVSLSSPVPLSGRLLVTARPDILFGGTNAYAVDLGSDGEEELAGTNLAMEEHFVEVPLVLGPEPTRIRLAAGSRASGLGYKISSVVQTVDFLATTGRIESIGIPCGPWFSGMLRNDLAGPHLTFKISNATPAIWSLVVLGTQPAQIAIPPSGCWLLQDPAIVVPVATPTGQLVIDVPLSAPLPPGDMRLQFARALQISGVIHWHTSESLRVRLP